MDIFKLYKEIHVDCFKFLEKLTGDYLKNSLSEKSGIFLGKHPLQNKLYES